MLKTEIDNSTLTIKRSIKSTVGIQLIWSIAGICFGSSFIYLSLIHNDDLATQFFTVGFGSIFVIVAIYLLIHLPGFYKRVSAEGGDIILKATSQGLLVAPMTNGVKNQYEWDLIESIYLADIGRGNAFANTGIGDGLRSYGNDVNRNVIIIIFKVKTLAMFNRGWIKNKINDLHKTPRGQYYTYSEYNPTLKSETISGLKAYATPDIKIESVNRVFFDYKNKKEIYE